jgi:hypothetical protein
MKITIDIECTPHEARSFFGLPHIEPMQDALVAQMQERLSRYLDATDAEALLRLWLPEGLKGFGQMQEQFWRQFFAGAMGGADKGKGETS